MLNKKSRYIEEWLLFAKEDLAIAELASKADNIFNRSICYHCQQSAEKDLKAYIIFLDLPLQKTHNLAKLVEQIAEIDINVKVINEIAITLSEYITSARYPDDFEIISDEESKNAILFSKNIKEYIVTNIKKLTGVK